MIFIYAFYIDLFVEQNFLMNLIVLSLTHTFCRIPVSFRYLRMFLSALCGAVASALFLLYVPSYGLATAASALLVVPAMLVIAFGCCGKKDFIVRAAISWLSIVILDGVAEAFANLTGIRSLTLYAGIAVLMAARLLTGFLLLSVKKLGRLYAVTLRQGSTQSKCLGLFDTGNLLSIPDTGEPVHIVSPALAGRLGLCDTDGMRLIPFHALGTESGWIRVVQVEQLVVSMRGGKRTYRSAWCGIAQENLLAGRSYQMILNAGLHENPGGCDAP